MPPKPKYTKEEIVDAAFEMVRENGVEALSARSIADRLSTSPRPIFTAFNGMDDLKSAVVVKCTETYLEFCKKEKESGKYPEYKAMGMAYIRFAKCEKNLFKLLFMRDTSNEQKGNDRLFEMGSSVVGQLLNLNTENSDKVHFEIWAWVHGIATMLATSFCDLDFDTISDMTTDIYQGLKGRYSNE